MNTFVFSVIVPTYRDPNLDLCLLALSEQSLCKSLFEVILINNDPDGDIQIPDTLFDVINLKILREEIPGSYAARNMGILHASGEILAFTDSDCIPSIDWLNNAYNKFRDNENSKIGILAGRIILFYNDEENLSAAEVYEKYTAFKQEEYVVEGNCLTANWFSYRTIILEFGGFNSQLKSNGDTDLSLKISQKYDIIYDSEIVVRHPARYSVPDLVSKYRRQIGGTFTRRYRANKVYFLGHIGNFTIRRLRFSLKKIFTVRLYESSRIVKVSVYLIIGAWQEYFHLLKDGDTRR